MRYLQALATILMPLSLSLAMLGGACLGATDPEIPTEEERRHEEAESHSAHKRVVRCRQARKPRAAVATPLRERAASDPRVIGVQAGHRLANGLTAPLLI